MQDLDELPDLAGLTAPADVVFTEGTCRQTVRARRDHFHVTRLQSGGETNVGQREHNEDAFAVWPEVGLFVVADGMGGYAGGRMASRLAVEAVTGFFAHHDGASATLPLPLDRNLSLSENLLHQAIRSAHDNVVAQKIGPNAQMGSTIVTLLVRDGEAIIAHVGDSRVYRLRGSILSQMTRDHSLYNEMVARGAAPSPGDAQFENAHVVTRALGMAGHAMPDLRRDPAQTGDTFLLCSDGLNETMDDEAIRRVLASAPPSIACERLVTQAVARGASDNTTAIVVRIAEI